MSSCLTKTASKLLCRCALELPVSSCLYNITAGFIALLMCRMSADAFDSTCAETQIQASNLSVTTVQNCMGSSDADQDHVLLKVRTVATRSCPFDACVEYSHRLIGAFHAAGRV